jgi:hypothetical protein
METTSSKAALATIAVLLFCAVFGAARAEQLYETYATAGAAAARALAERRQEMIDECAQNNGIECEREVDTELRAEGLQWVPSLRYGEREEQAAARALAERRQQMIDDCEQNHGTECAREVDTELRAEALQSGARVIRLRPAR